VSVEAMGWALPQPIGGNEKLVLLGLANHARPDGTEARPAVATLAAYAFCSDRTVQRVLRALEADGWIECTGTHEVARGGRVNVYRLVYERGDNLTPRQDDGVTPVTRRGDTRVADGVTPLSPKPSFEPSLNHPATPPPPPAGGRRRHREAWEQEAVAWARSLGLDGHRNALLYAVKSAAPWDASDPAGRLRAFVRASPMLDITTDPAGIVAGAATPPTTMTTE
jgi:hypothetical protein